MNNNLVNNNVNDDVSNNVSKQPKDSVQDKSTEVTDAKPNTSDNNKKSRTAATATVAKPSRLPLLVALLALLMALTALTSTAYVGWRGKALEDRQPALQSEQEYLQSQIARQQARLTETIQTLSPVEQQIEALQQRNDRLLNRIDVLSRHVRELAGSSRDGWQLAEVEYLLRLANQKLLMTSDVISARTLLQDADNILLELDDYSLFPVREALAEDLAVLRMVPHLDQEGIYLRLSALSHQVDKLPLLQPEGFNGTTPVNRTEALPAKVLSTEAPATETESSGWQSVLLDMLKNTWDSFTGLFRFTTDRTSPAMPLLTAEDNLLMRQNLKLLIEQVKLALLAREQGIYDESLQQAQSWVQRYFEMSGDTSLGMLKELQSLSSVTVSPKLPNINRALDAIEQFQSSDKPSGSPESSEIAPDNKATPDNEAAPDNEAPPTNEQEADSEVHTS
ncbi:uroporphyrinogen-III C-methyltransferase [Endozoicomonas euniceicola]|uniref:Uroporphyrinogen-III C-methyltransferase n=1 Tax=Endozoicomonas euniceicola TaxID=1234143 RepID=A0ABY6GYU1_9GAMM|nr:uroporphyrinogen-III C-methyltransferase [Endozoicomonas euniceicola]UYM17992.1 uroporphyrinogen-III C-methyltransferase [Endozoicomonas euniceicola]